MKNSPVYCPGNCASQYESSIPCKFKTEYFIDGSGMFLDDCKFPIDGDYNKCLTFQNNKDNLESSVLEKEILKTEKDN